MKLVIAGGRNMDRFTVNFFKGVFVMFDIPFTDADFCVIQGGCSGVDEAAKKLCEVLGIKCHEEKANWYKHGRAAGPIRNAIMAQKGDALLLIWNGKSNGSASMKREMEKLGKPVHEIIIK